MKYFHFYIILGLVFLSIPKNATGCSLPHSGELNHRCCQIEKKNMGKINLPKKFHQFNSKQKNKDNHCHGHKCDCTTQHVPTAVLVSDNSSEEIQYFGTPVKLNFTKNYIDSLFSFIWLPPKIS